MNPATYESSSAAFPRAREHGIALVAAMLILTVLSLVAMALVSSVVSDKRMTSDDISESKALRYAEAGVAEALNRIQNGLDPTPVGGSPAHGVVQILLNASPGTGGTDTTLLTTGQPNGQWLTYSTVSPGPNALTIEYRTNAARTLVMKYDKAANPPIQNTTGLWIFRITSTGRVGAVTRRLVVEAVRPKGISLLGAVVSGSDIKYTGEGLTCGYNHRADTPDHKGNVPGRAVVGGCLEDAAANQWETGSGNMVGDYVRGTYSFSGSNLHYGSPSGIADSKPSFYAGPWEVLGMTKAQFITWAGPPVATPPANPVGVVWVDNDNVPGNLSAPAAKYNSPSIGSGLLYVDGDLEMTNDFHFRGLVYCEGYMKATNQAWILGSLVARGPTSGRNDVSGPNVFLYSSAAIEQIPTLPASGKVTAISWKQVQ